MDTQIKEYRRKQQFWTTYKNLKYFSSELMNLKKMES